MSDLLFPEVHMSPAFTRKDFLDALFSGYYKKHRGFLVVKSIRTKDSKIKVRYFPNIESLAKQDYRPNENVYFGICPRERMTIEKEHIHYVVALWADLDIGIESHNGKSFLSDGPQEAVKAVRGFPKAPSIIAESGGRVHLYWLLKNVTEVTDVAKIERMLKDIGNYLGCATDVSLDSVLTLPGMSSSSEAGGLVNCDVKFINNNFRYSLQDFENLTSRATTIPARSVPPTFSPPQARTGAPASDPISEMLLRAEIIDEEELKRAFDYQRDQGGKVYRALVKLGCIAEEDLLEFLSRQSGLPTISLDEIDVDPDAVKLITAKKAQEYMAIPFRQVNSTLHVAIADPTDMRAINDIKFMTNLSVKASIATETQIRKTLGTYYDAALHGEEMPEGARTGEILHELTGELSAPSMKGTLAAGAPRSSSEEMETGTPVPELGHSVDGAAQEIYEDTVQLDLEDIELDDSPSVGTSSEYIVEYGPDLSWEFGTEDAIGSVVEILPDSDEPRDGELDFNFGVSSSPTSPLPPEPEGAADEPAALTRTLAESPDYGAAESHSPLTSSNRPSVILRYEGTSTTLIPEGALPPFSKRFRLKGLHGSRSQVLEIFQATLRIGAISLPEHAANNAKTREIEMVVECDGEELDIHVSDPASGYKQSLRFLLPSWDWLNCSIFAPPKVHPGEPFLVQGFVHLPAHAERVLAMARQADEDAQVRGTCGLGSLVGRGSSLTSFLAVSNPDVDYEAQQMVWRGEPIAGQFDVLVPKDFSSRHVIGTVVAVQDNVPIGQVRFKIKVAVPSQTKKRLQNLWMKQGRFSLASIAEPLRTGRKKSSSESNTDIPGGGRRNER